MILSPTRHVPAPIHPRYSPEAIRTVARGFFTPGNHTHHPTSPFIAGLFRRRRRRNKPQIGRKTHDVFAACGGKNIVGMCWGMWCGHGSWGKETPGYGADRLRRKRRGRCLNTPRPAPSSSLLHRARSSLDQRHNPTRHSGCAARRPVGPQNGNKPCTPKSPQPQLFDSPGLRPSASSLTANCRSTL